MNYKVLALGAVIGFAAALTPACGGSSCDTCTSNGTCVSATSASQCGSNGDTCQACAAGDSCVAGKCVTTTADAGPGTCNAANCPTGCCSSAGVCLAGNTLPNCGSGGAQCTPCLAGETCGIPSGSTARQCFVKPVPDAGTQIGDTCATTADCTHDLGATAVCKTGSETPPANSDGGWTFAHGFCTEPCTGTCDSNSTCLLNVFTVDGGTTKSLVGFAGTAGQDGSCFKNCDSTAGADVCGAGFFCQAISQTASVCLPLTPMPKGVAGQACSTDGTVCSNPPSSGFCYPESTSSGATGFSGGACMADCTEGDIACGTESLCVGVSSSQAFCIETCATPHTRSTCRTHYTCAPLTKSDGSELPQGACLPDCSQPNWSCSADAGTCNTTTGQCG
jgi:hypothetical protein